MAADVRYDGSGVFNEIAPDEGDVLPFYAVVEELFGQAANGGLRFREYHEAGGILVDAVHESPAGQVLLGEGFVLLQQVPGDPVDQRAGVIPAGRMDDQTGWFVDDHHIVIL